MFLLRFTKDTEKSRVDPVSIGRWYYYSFEGIVGKKSPHQAWRTDTLEKAKEALDFLQKQEFEAEIVEFKEKKNG